MSRVDISPEQRAADAAGPAIAAIRAVASETTRYSPMGMRPPLLVCPGRHAGWITLYDQHGGRHPTPCCLILDARVEWYYAHPDDIHVFRVPSDLETVEVSSVCQRRSQHAGAHGPRRRQLDGSDFCGAPLLFSEVVDAGELGGPPFAIPFVDYLDYSHEAIIRGLREQRRLCAARHATWPDHRGRAVCGALLWSVVANGNSVEYAADEAELTPERAGELLLRALGAVWTWRSREANGLRSAMGTINEAAERLRDAALRGRAE